MHYFICSFVLIIISHHHCGTQSGIFRDPRSLSPRHGPPLLQKGGWVVFPDHAPSLAKECMDCLKGKYCNWGTPRLYESSVCGIIYVVAYSLIQWMLQAIQCNPVHRLCVPKLSLSFIAASSPYPISVVETHHWPWRKGKTSSQHGTFY